MAFEIICFNDPSVVLFVFVVILIFQLCSQELSRAATFFLLNQWLHTYEFCLPSPVTGFGRINVFRRHGIISYTAVSFSCPPYVEINVLTLRVKTLVVVSNFHPLLPHIYCRKKHKLSLYSPTFKADANIRNRARATLLFPSSLSNQATAIVPQGIAQYHIGSTGMIRCIFLKVLVQ